MLLLVFASLGVLVVEDEVNLELISMHSKFKSVDCRTLLVAPHLSGPNMIT